MKRSKFVLIALILGALYFGYIFNYFYLGGASSAVGTDATSQLGAGLAGAVVTPHIVTTGIAVLMNAIGYFAKSRGFTLTAAILYIIAIVTFPPYFIFVTLQAIFSFIGYFRMKNTESLGGN